MTPTGSDVDSCVGGAVGCVDNYTRIALGCLCIQGRGHWTSIRLCCCHCRRLQTPHWSSLLRGLTATKTSAAPVFFLRRRPVSEERRISERALPFMNEGSWGVSGRLDIVGAAGTASDVASLGCSFRLLFGALAIARAAPDHWRATSQCQWLGEIWRLSTSRKHRVHIARKRDCLAILQTREFLLRQLSNKFPTFLLPDALTTRSYGILSAATLIRCSMTSCLLDICFARVAASRSLA